MTDPITATDSTRKHAEDKSRLGTGEVFLRGKPVMGLEDVPVSFSGRAAVRGVTFDIHEKEVTALIGPSGSGKTTVLRVLTRMPAGSGMRRQDVGHHKEECHPILELTVDAAPESLRITAAATTDMCVRSTPSIGGLCGWGHPRGTVWVSRRH
jgi:ABC-type molybdenum transport system ATPase subunit/photorepair protein PhrA